MGQAAKTILTIGSIIAAPFTGGATAWIPGALAGAATIAGIVDTASAQGQQNNAYDAATGAQSDALANVSKIAAGETAIGDKTTALGDQAAQGPSLQSLIDAQAGGVKTFQSVAGGVPNIGALVKDLFSGNIQNALEASIKQRNNNLSTAGGLYSQAASDYQGAGGLYTGAGSQYAGAASAAADAAGKTGAGYGGLLSGLGDLANKFGKGGGGGGIPTGYGGATIDTSQNQPPLAPPGDVPIGSVDTPQVPPFNPGTPLPIANQPGVGGGQ